jgi:hypothetical protein
MRGGECARLGGVSDAGSSAARKRRGIGGRDASYRFYGPRILLGHCGGFILAAQLQAKYACLHI